MTVNILGGDVHGGARAVPAKLRWPLVPIALACFALSALFSYHLQSDAAPAASALQSLVIGIYRLLGFAPSCLLFLLVLAWSSIWYLTQDIERPVERVLRLLGFTLAIAIWVNLRADGQPSLPHHGALGAWFAERMVSVFGYVPSTLVAAPITIAALLLATDYLFYRYFEGLGFQRAGSGARPREQVDGVEDDVTEAFKALARTSPEPLPAQPAAAREAPVAGLAGAAAATAEEAAAVAAEREPRAAEPEPGYRSRRSRRSWRDQEDDELKIEPLAPGTASAEAPQVPLSIEDEFAIAAAALGAADPQPPVVEPAARERGLQGGAEDAADESPAASTPPARGYLAPVAAEDDPAERTRSDESGPAGPGAAAVAAGAAEDVAVAAPDEADDEADDAAADEDEFFALQDDVEDEDEVDGETVDDEDAEEVGKVLATADDENDEEDVDAADDEDEDEIEDEVDGEFAAADADADEDGEEDEESSGPAAGQAAEPVVQIPRAHEGARQRRLFANLDEDLVAEAVEVVTSTRRASATHLQRQLRVDYEQAVELLAALAQRGVIELDAGETSGRVR